MGRGGVKEGKNRWRWATRRPLPVGVGETPKVLVQEEKRAETGLLAGRGGRDDAYRVKKTICRKARRGRLRVLNRGKRGETCDREKRSEKERLPSREEGDWNSCWRRS